VSRPPTDRYSRLSANYGPYLAEAIAAFTLVFAGCGAVAIDSTSHGQITHVGVAITFGLVIAAMIYATGHISGAHINPVVTLAFALTRHFPFARVPGYWLAQLVGAAAESGVLRALFGNVAHLGTTLLSNGDGQSFVLESDLTFFLMFVIMAVATDDRATGQAAALAIGGTVLLDAMFGGPISGASMNPARSFGPALASGTWGHLWVYVLGPVVGALLAAFAYEVVRGNGRIRESRRTRRPRKWLAMRSSPTSMPTYRRSGWFSPISTVATPVSRLMGSTAWVIWAAMAASQTRCRSA